MDYVNSGVEENDEENREKANYVSWGWNKVYCNQGQPRPYYCNNNNQTYYKGAPLGYHNQNKKQEKQ